MFYPTNDADDNAPLKLEFGGKQYRLESSDFEKGESSPKTN
jgi:hypothetical protein